MNNDHGFTRTTCACKACVACCRRQPGPLAPNDMEKIAEFLGISLTEAKAYFWASPGSLVKNIVTGEIRRIGSITPRFRKGRCVFLDQNDRCRIHPVAPFGCAYFDTHMTVGPAQERGVWMAVAHEDKEYQKLRDELPVATHYRPAKYKS